MSVAVIVSLCISVPICVYYGYQVLKDAESRDRARRFLKYMFTGKYEPPKKDVNQS